MKSVRKLENIQERALRFIHKDYVFSFEYLLKISKSDYVKKLKNKGCEIANSLSLSRIYLGPC